MTDDNEHTSHFTFSSHSNQSEFSFGNSINLIISGFKKHCHTEYRERDRDHYPKKLLTSPNFFSQHAASFLFKHSFMCTPSSPSCSDFSFALPEIS